jgi:hypothetical protein
LPLPLTVELVIEPFEKAVELMVRVKTRLLVYREPDCEPDVGVTREVMVVVMTLRVELAGVAEVLDEEADDEPEADAAELVDWAMTNGARRVRTESKGVMQRIFCDVSMK